MKVHVPTLEQVAQLGTLWECVVPPDWEDLNGHVNVKHYLNLYNEVGLPMLRQLGVDEDYFRRTRRGFFDLEHHLWYLAEIHVGDRVTLHHRYLARSAKRFHGQMYVVNATRANVASMLEFVATGADLETRRTAEFPPEVAFRIDAMIAEHARLAWAPSLCGSMVP